MNWFRRTLARPFSRIAAALLALAPMAAAAKEGSAPPVRPALWKVADADTTIYLFGTVHVLPAGIEWYGGKVATAFESSQELVTEIVEMPDAQTKVAMVGQAALPEGQTLREMLDPADRARYEAALVELGMPANAFDRYEPWLAAMIMSVVPLAKVGLSPDNGVDKALGVKADMRKLKHEGLETYEYQLGLFDSLPLDTQKRYLSQVVKDMPNAREDIGRMIDAWKHGDAVQLAALMNAQEDYPGMYEVLLTNRNKVWAGWIDERLKQPGTVFVAVGAGHLAGPGSVQEQLQTRGIASERLQ